MDYTFMEANPKFIAKRLMDRSLREVKIVADLLQKDCECTDHIGPHDIQLSRIRLLENYHKLSDVFDYYPILTQNPRAINELFGFFAAELERVEDLKGDINVLAWMNPARSNQDNGDTTS